MAAQAFTFFVEGNTIQLPPSNVVLTMDNTYSSGGNLSAAWSAPATGRPASSYSVVYTTGSPTSITVSTSDTTSSITPDGNSYSLVIGNSYKVTVYCRNATGAISSDGVTSSAKTYGSTPFAPTIGSFSESSSDSVLTISWSNNGNNTLAYTVASYTIKIYSGTTAALAEGGGTQVGNNITGVTSSPYTITFTPGVGTFYSATVSAVNAIGTSTASGVAAGYCYLTTPDPTQYLAIYQSGTSLIVSWAAATNVNTNGHTINSYIIKYNSGTTSANVAYLAQVTGVSKDATSYTITTSPFTPTTLNFYSASIYAQNVIGQNSTEVASGTIRFFAMPSSPTIGSLSQSGSTMTLTWTAPNNANTAPYTVDNYYIVFFSVSGTTYTYVGAAWATPWSASTTSYSFTDTPFTPSAGTTYSAYVQSYNSYGFSSPSGYATGYYFLGVPNAPTIGSLTQAGAVSTLTISWTAPTAGYQSITSYNVDFFNNGAQVGATVNVGSTIRSLTISGYTPLAGTAYTARVYALNIAGSSGQSSWATAYTVLGDVQNFTGAPNGLSFPMTWSALSGATNYYVDYSTGSTTSGAATNAYNSTGTSYTITFSNGDGVPLYATIYAKNGSNYGPRSRVIGTMVTYTPTTTGQYTFNFTGTVNMGMQGAGGGGGGMSVGGAGGSTSGTLKYTGSTTIYWIVGGGGGGGANSSSTGAGGTGGGGSGGGQGAGGGGGRSACGTNNPPDHVITGGGGGGVGNHLGTNHGTPVSNGAAGGSETGGSASDVASDTSATGGKGGTSSAGGAAGTGAAAGSSGTGGKGADNGGTGGGGGGGYYGGGGGGANYTTWNTYWDNYHHQYHTDGQSAICASGGGGGSSYQNTSYATVTLTQGSGGGGGGINNNGGNGAFWLWWI